MKSMTISVVMPTFNRAALVESAVKSALSQTFPIHELLVVDDGSTDDTLHVLKQIDSRVRVIHQSNQGPAAARNTGVAAATGEWIAFLDSDDLWHSTKLEKQSAALGNNPKSSGCYCAGEHIDQYGETIYTPPFFPDCSRTALFTRCLRSVPMMTSSVVIRRSSILEAGGFDVSLRYTDDWDLFGRLIGMIEFVSVSEPLVQYRRHKGNLTNNHRECLRDDLEVIDRLYKLPMAYKYKGQRAGIIGEMTRDKGIDLFYQGQQADARTLLLKSLAAQPNLMSLSYLAKTLVPKRWLAAVRDRRKAKSAIR